MLNTKLFRVLLSHKSFTTNNKRQKTQNAESYQDLEKALSYPQS
jgi:hypothetical protein